MAKKTYIYMVEVRSTYSKEREGQQVSLNPYSSFEKAKKAVDSIYDQCVKEAKKYPSMSVTEKQSTWVPDDDVKFLAWTFTWTVKAGFIDEEYMVKIKRLEVQ